LLSFTQMYEPVTRIKCKEFHTLFKL